MNEQRPAPASWGATEPMPRVRMANDFLAREIALALESLRAFEAAHKQLQAALDAATRERDEARAEVERLREALRWYTDPRNSDSGTRARLALWGKP